MRRAVLPPLRTVALLLALGVPASSQDAPPEGSAVTVAEAPHSSATDGVSLEVRPARGEVSIGEPLAVDVVAKGPSGTEWTFPVELLQDDVELRAVIGDEPLGPDRQRYEATVYALDEAELPAIEVGYRLPDGTRGTLASEPVSLKVVSLLPRGEEEPELTDVRPPLSLDIGAAFWAGLFVLMALLGGLAYWLWRRRRLAKATAATAVPATPPDVEARAALERLAARRLPASGEPRAFYIELTQIAKRYLERRLGAPVLEMTSIEACGFLRDHAQGRELLTPFRELSGAADRVKFARGNAVVAEADGHLAQVRALVDTLETRLAPPPQGEQAA